MKLSHSVENIWKKVHPIISLTEEQYIKMIKIKARDGMWSISPSLGKGLIENVHWWWSIIILKIQTKSGIRSHCSLIPLAEPHLIKEQSPYFYTWEKKKKSILGLHCTDKRVSDFMPQHSAVDLVNNSIQCFSSSKLHRQIHKKPDQISTSWYSYTVFNTACTISTI